MLVGSDRGEEEDEGWNEECIRCRNAREPLLRIGCDPILDDLLVMETNAECKGSQKGERSESCVGNGNPAGGERDGGNFVARVAGDGHGDVEQERGVDPRVSTRSTIHSIISVGKNCDAGSVNCAIIRSATAFAHSNPNLNTQIHGSKEAGKVPSSL